MRNIVFGALIIVFAFLSCNRSDDDSLQRIDQILNIYMKNSSGQDLLNSQKTGSYTNYFINDSLGDRENSPVSIPLKMAPDSTFYMEYIAGAKRKKLDSSGTAYYSVMTLGLRTVTNNVADTIFDRLRIVYRMSPTLFQVSKVYYNDVLEYSKEAEAPTSINRVTITK
ncbi:hypothetical protein [Chryseobacterium sp.]|uniref:hypothetical protein n=1 Tax=Chryseobacterium sp. TaxID=1871047 RepID=UPI0025BEA714|nr:hypothetical protein [Chryseobacterium sp.]MBV8325909.1 hypothetical protein [Chryseobacterium sp.]